MSDGTGQNIGYIFCSFPEYSIFIAEDVSIRQSVRWQLSCFKKNGKKRPCIWLRLGDPIRIYIEPLFRKKWV